MRGKTGRDPDGTEHTEYRCPKCKKVFADVKIPHDALLGGEMGWKE